MASDKCWHLLISNLNFVEFLPNQIIKWIEISLPSWHYSLVLNLHGNCCVYFGAGTLTPAMWSVFNQEKDYED